MAAQETCPACGARWHYDETCETHFHQMLFWEAEFPELGIVHHLMVLGYHLQHPYLYSEEGLKHSKQLLAQFVVDGLSPQEVRDKQREQVDSGNRTWKVTARPDSQGQYENPVHWTMTAADVVASGSAHYIERVQAWAQSIYDDLKASGNL